MTEALSTVQQSTFRLEPRIEGLSLIVQFSGNGDMTATDPLNDYLSWVHTEAMRKGLKEVAFDFANLFFMNSSCLKAFICWIHVVDDAGRPYKIRFLANGRLHWQERSLATIARMAPNIVTIQPAPGTSS
jgi:hypothetical protein